MTKMNWDKVARKDRDVRHKDVPLTKRVRVKMAPLGEFMVVEREQIRQSRQEEKEAREASESRKTSVKAAAKKKEQQTRERSSLAIRAAKKRERDKRERNNPALRKEREKREKDVLARRTAKKKESEKRKRAILALRAAEKKKRENQQRISLAEEKEKIWLTTLKRCFSCRKEAQINQYLPSEGGRYWRKCPACGMNFWSHDFHD